MCLLVLYLTQSLHFTSTLSIFCLLVSSTLPLTPSIVTTFQPVFYDYLWPYSLTSSIIFLFSTFLPLEKFFRFHYLLNVPLNSLFLILFQLNVSYFSHFHNLHSHFTLISPLTFHSLYLFPVLRIFSNLNLLLNCYWFSLKFHCFLLILILW